MSASGEAARSRHWGFARARWTFSVPRLEAAVSRTNGTEFATNPSAQLLIKSPNTRSLISACSAGRSSHLWRGGSYTCASNPHVGYFRGNVKGGGLYGAADNAPS